jgi:1,4-dihydroxy-2-naphthoate octaprenyltransferase
VTEYLRLAFGTALVLLPGAALARLQGRRSVSATLAWTLAAVFVAWAVVFILHSNIRVAVLVLGLITVGALAAKRFTREPSSRSDLGSGGALLVGVVLGWFLWHVAGAVVGDGLFHEGRVRKLVDLGDLHLRTVGEFKDGGLHPGYAFPLWHGFDALVAWFSGLDPDVVMRHESSLLAPIAVAVAYEAGVAVFRSRAGGVAVALAQLAIFCFGPGHGGSYATLVQPGSASRQLLVPAAVALFFSRNLPATAAIFGALALVHPTYAIFLLIPLLAVAFWEPRSYLAAALPVGVALLWLRPIVDETNTHNPTDAQRANDIAQYRDQLVVSNLHHFRLAPEVLGRSGAVAVAALVVLPVAALAWRTTWARFALGGALVVLLLMEVPWLFVHFSDAVSLSQSRRAAGFVPLPFVFAGAFALLARRVWVVPIAFVAGVAVQRRWPGDFGYGLRHGGPAAATWIALAGGAAALLVAVALRRPPLEPRFGLGAAAAAAFTLPVIVHGAWHWSPAAPTDPGALSPRLVHNLRTKVPKGAIVIAPIQTSYRVVAAAPLYVVAAPLTHVANTKANRSVERFRDDRHWVQTDDPSIPAKWGATWQIRSGRLARVGPRR